MVLQTDYVYHENNPWSDGQTWYILAGQQSSYTSGGCWPVNLERWQGLYCCPGCVDTWSQNRSGSPSLILSSYFK